MKVEVAPHFVRVCLGMLEGGAERERAVDTPPVGEEHVVQRADGSGVDQRIDIRPGGPKSAKRLIDGLALDVEKSRSDRVGEHLHGGARE